MGSRTDRGIDCHDSGRDRVYVLWASRAMCIALINRIAGCVEGDEFLQPVHQVG